MHSISYPTLACLAALLPSQSLAALLPSQSLAAEDGAKIKIGGRFEVETKLDIPYYDGKDADARKQKLDLFLPKGQKDFPVLFFVHGGAWVSGDRKMYGSLGHLFAKNGVGTVVISYRLSPEVQHPKHIEDVAKAFAWTHQNIGKYGGKADRIFVSGHSAGGHLSALLATNETYLKAEKLTLKDIRGAMPMSGIYDIPPRLLDSIIGKGEEAKKSASPLKNVTAKDPPFLILYADGDFPGCAKMSKDFSEALVKNKVDSTLVEIKDRNHITVILYLMLNEADPASQALLGFIAKHSELKLQPRPEK